METNFLYMCISFILISSLPQSIHPAKILSVTFISTKSNLITYQPLFHALANKGHEVTVLTPYKLNQNVNNLREIVTIDLEQLSKNENTLKEYPNIFEMKDKGYHTNPMLMFNAFANLCRETYSLPHVQAVMKEQFDLVIFQEFYNECTAGFVHKLNTTVISISPVSAPSWLTSNIGGHMPPSFVPNIFGSYTSRMNFYERTMNFLVEVTVSLIRDFYYEPWMVSIYREKLGDPTIPSSDVIFKNTSLILSNGHFVLGSPKPFLPDVVEVGGMHCRPAQPLPKDLDDFANSNKDGFILFSMGTALKGSTMPEEKRKQILGAFSKLKQNVLWKWETETMPDLPKNVKLIKWLPQQDILGHPKLKLFITHGGFGGTTESVYHGVPLVGIPIQGDQLFNMQNAEKLGFAINFDYLKINEDTLYKAIMTVINEPKYKQSAMALSKAFRDQPDKPLDRAVFWTEYVLRHKGAVHLRSVARDLTFIQYHSLDVIGFLLTIILTVLYILYAIFRFIVRKLCVPKVKTSSDLRKKKN